MSIVDEIQQRIDDAEAMFLDILKRDFEESLSLPIEEVMRRHVEALKQIVP